MSDLKIQGPIDVELKVSVTNGEQNGVATITLGRGCYPTEQSIRDRVAKFAKDEMPEGFRLMTKREYWDTICPPIVGYDEEEGEHYTTRYAMPGGDEYDA